jgi:hypothetical protein
MELAESYNNCSTGIVLVPQEVNWFGSSRNRNIAA